MSKKRPCGSSWVGFWKLKDRKAAWLSVADSASKTADCYAMVNKRCGLPLNSECVCRLNRLFSWAYNRAKKIKQ